MSYEGYEVLVCAKGHFNCLDHLDVIGNPCDQPHCDCGEPIVRIGSVDETNCLPYTLDFKLVLKTPEVVETCPCCKHTAVKEEATYTFVKVPPYESEDGNFIFKEPTNPLKN